MPSKKGEICGPWETFFLNTKLWTSGNQNERKTVSTSSKWKNRTEFGSEPVSFYTEEKRWTTVTARETGQESGTEQLL